MWRKEEGHNGSEKEIKSQHTSKTPPARPALRLSRSLLHLHILNLTLQLLPSPPLPQHLLPLLSDLISLERFCMGFVTTTTNVCVGKSRSVGVAGHDGGSNG